MGCKLEVKETVNKDFNSAKQFLRPHHSGAHGMCHACHTLDTPPRSTLTIFHWSWNFWEIFSVNSFLKNFSRMKPW